MGSYLDILYCPAHDAAYDLLAALTGLVNAYDKNPELMPIGDARAAIAKARGQL